MIAEDRDLQLLTFISCWRGDGVETTSNDILRQFFKMKGTLPVHALIYDAAAKDFFLTARDELRDEGIELIPAKKDRVAGFERVNSYLEANAIQIPEYKPDGLGWWDKGHIEKLHDEFRTVIQPHGQKKSGVIDDLTDCVRYGCMSIHLELELVRRRTGLIVPRRKLLRHGRHEYFADEFSSDVVSNELKYWTSLYN